MLKTGNSDAFFREKCLTKNKLCRSDYKVFEPFHCRMIRYYTVANGDAYCDFWQVGDQSNAWKNADRSRLI